MNTAEKFLILIHQPEKSGYLVQGQVRNTGLIGSILLDLAGEEKIVIENGRIRANSIRTSLSPSHQQVLDKIYRAEKPKKVRAWIARFTQGAGRYYKPVISVLERKGVVRIEHRQFLFISYMKTRVTARKARAEIINQVREVVFNDKPADDSIASLLGIIAACRIHRLICRDRNELRPCRLKLQEITKGDSISKGVASVIKETRAAIMVAMTTSAAAVAASSR